MKTLKRFVKGNEDLPATEAYLNGDKSQKVACRNELIVLISAKFYPCERVLRKQVLALFSETCLD